MTNLLDTNSYVIVIALDFTRAFDTVRHYCLMEKVSELNVPDNIYNWIANFLSGHSHCTRYQGRTSDLLDITASRPIKAIIQWSAIGPASFVVHVADLRAARAGNFLIKMILM